MKSEPVLLATRSAGKLRELLPLLRRLGRPVLTLEDAGIPYGEAEEGVEVFETFEDNAMAKARYFRGASGMDVLADDSGLEVLVLDGAPGVRSKRWSGVIRSDGSEDEGANRAKLLRELEGIADRRARFVCAAAYAGSTGEVVVRGETAGVIGLREEGDGGFGYDSLFWSEELGRTLASCSVEEKEGVSHRGRAFRELVGRLTRGS